MQVTLVRHGQSQWNFENRFTGWMDVDLTVKGIEEAVQAGQLLADSSISFGKAYTSLLTRAQKTLFHILDQTKRLWIPVEKSWRLNERHYGGLTGLNKAETAKKYGEEQVHIWRRSYDVAPPEMEMNQAQILYADPRYDQLPHNSLPLTENLAMTVDRVKSYWLDAIYPDLKAGKNLLVVAHGNSLRALCKIIEDIPDKKIDQLEIATGQPIIYTFDEQVEVVGKRVLNFEGD